MQRNLPRGNKVTFKVFIFITTEQSSFHLHIQPYSFARKYFLKNATSAEQKGVVLFCFPMGFPFHHHLLYRGTPEWLNIKWDIRLRSATATTTMTKSGEKEKAVCQEISLCSLATRRSRMMVPIQPGWIFTAATRAFWYWARDAAVKRLVEIWQQKAKKEITPLLPPADCSKTFNIQKKKDTEKQNLNSDVIWSLGRRIVLVLYCYVTAYHCIHHSSVKCL